MGSSHSFNMTAHQPKIGPCPIKRSDRILIVGAGPSGIHMATLLKKRGFDKITLLEKSDHFGGHAHSIRSDKYGGVDCPHEMGACYMHPGYKNVFAHLKEYNAGADVIPADRCVFSQLNPPKLEPSLEWCLQQNAQNVGGAWSCIKPVQGLALYQAILKYVKLRRSILGTHQYGLPPPLTKQHLKLIDMTMAQFLEENGLRSLMPVFLIAHSAQGYGLMEHVPALYGLWWISEDFIEGYINKMKGKGDVLHMTSTGYQALMEKMAERHQLDIRLNVEITGIRRNLEAKDGKMAPVVVETKGDSYEGDFLILAGPFAHLIKLIQDAQPLEREIMSSVQTHCLNTVLVSTPFPKDREKFISGYIPEVLVDTQDPGRVYAYRNSMLAINSAKYHVLEDEVDKLRQAVGYVPPDPLLLLESKNADERKDTKQKEQMELKDPSAESHRRYVVNYHFTEEFSGSEDTRKQLIEWQVQCMRDRGEDVSDVRIHEVRMWEHFHFFSQSNINKRYPWKLFDMQGQYRTFYIGSSACFESVEDVMAYNNLIMAIHVDPNDNQATHASLAEATDTRDLVRLTGMVVGLPGDVPAPLAGKPK